MEAHIVTVSRRGVGVGSALGAGRWSRGPPACTRTGGPRAAGGSYRFFSPPLGNSAAPATTTSHECVFAVGSIRRRNLIERRTASSVRRRS
ncbi:hypothetical protein EVAR_80455_1 [Eumeta japonica]|uniref:Uncharacterized protein n=1 Tax=Eumeta variegata TaxID=151549 RepID=A0A4C1VHW2_EUMVA|nr:hypothetical protein EVAR_80455_1 [Eumeta japonica]